MKVKMQLLLFLCGLSLLYGQQSTIGLQPTKAISIKNAVEAEKVNQKIKEIILTTGTYEILDREALGIIKNEQDIQKQITSINADVVAQGKIKGAEFIIASRLYEVIYKKIEVGKGLKGSINSVLGSKSNDNATMVRAILSFSIDILDTETGATVNSQKFNVGTISDNTGGLTEEEALRAALKAKSLNKKMSQFLNKSGGNTIKLISIEEDNGDEATLVLINSGSSSNTKKNSKFKVYQLSKLTIDGEETTREKWVADLKVSAIEGEKLSTAKVDKGGKKLKQLFESGAALICKTK